LYQTPLSANGKQRLTVMRESSDGFYIAEKDLELRGPGEVLGTRQTGLMEFRIAELPTHDHLLDDVETLANQIREQHSEMADPLIQRWTGASQQFAKV
jgi:ATP-dependent DNA helicase RecG